jgi:hypothetical protein
MEVIGRSEAFKNYIGTANREISFLLQFRAQGLTSGSKETVLREEVSKPARFLEGLKYPLIDELGIAHSPPACILILGELLRLRVIATQIDITWQPPFDVDTMLPHGADVQCTFTAVHSRIENYMFEGPNRLGPVQEG